MVVVCVVYCDCDLTALLYLLLEVCAGVCSCVQLCACLHKQIQLCRDRERITENTRTHVSVHLVSY